MLIKHIWSVLCRESVINKDDNAISLNGILEKINSTLIPIKTPRKQEKIVIPLSYEIISFWTKEIDKEVNLDIKIALVDPKGNQLEELTNNLIFPKESKRLRTRFRIQGLPVSVNGIYLFRVSLKLQKEKRFTIISEVPLEVEYTILPQQKGNVKPNVSD